MIVVDVAGEGIKDSFHVIVDWNDVYLNLLTGKEVYTGRTGDR
jgi:hypothetical protein